MVNRESSFNRRKVNKLKTIRVNKRSTARNKHNSFKKPEQERELTKKEMKKQKRLDKIYENLGVKESEIVNKKIIKRRNQKKKKQAKEDQMDIE
jgi:hypothetical protein